MGDDTFSILNMTQLSLRVSTAVQEIVFHNEVKNNYSTTGTSHGHGKVC